jgi:hypothetical protein
MKQVVAYLDPGSGSMIAGAIAAGFAGMVVVFKTNARRVTGVFSRKNRSAEVDAPAADNER